MDNRFTFKDFVFSVLFILVLGAVVFVGYQFNYQEQRLTALGNDFSDSQKQQVALLSEIRNVLKNGGAISTNSTTAQGETATKPGRIRRKNPDGSIYVLYPDIPTSPRHPESQPDYATGDWLTENIAMEPGNLAPYVANDMGAQIVQGPVLESLVALNPVTLEFEPWLADWYEISPDGLRFTFHLRSQACFSDGVAMTADDVVFSFKTVMNEEVDCAPLRSYYDKVKDCRKIDDRTVEFKMSEPYFLAMEFIGGLSIIPEHIYHFTKGDEFNKRSDLLVASGPYRMDKWDRGQKITMVRNEKYWADRPSYDKIIYLFIGNQQAALQSFLAEQLDYIGQPIPPEPDMYIKYSNDAEFLKKFIARKYTASAEMYMYVGYNEAKPMFKDKQTRQALTMLIDRKAIITQLIKGFGTEMTGPFCAGSAQNDETVKALPYDVDAAKKKLAEAGWKANSDGILERDGVKFEFDLSFRTNVKLREDIATYLQQQFLHAGIRMRLTPYESSVLIENLDNRKFDACLAGWGPGGVEGDPKQIWHSSSMADKGSNAVGFNNKEADALIEQGERTMDKAARTEIWHKFQRVVYEEQPYTFLYSEQDCAFINGRFRNTEPYASGLSELDWYVPLALQKHR